MKNIPSSTPSVARHLTTFLAVVAWFCATSEPLGAAKPKSETFKDQTQVVEVQVPVNVLDRKGESIRGLTADDFEILDGNVRRDILDFQVVDLDLVQPGHSRVEIERAVPPSARRHILLLFDLSFSQPSSVIRARTAARDFVLNKLNPTDLVAVAINSVDTGVRMLVTFTPDRAQVARAVDTMGAPRLLSLAQRDPLNFLIDTPDAVGLSASSDLGGSESGDAGEITDAISAHFGIIAKEMAKMEKSFLRGRISSWSRSMGDMATFLASVQGRKHVIYFSEGFDGRLLLGRQPSALDAEQEEDMLNLQTGNIGLVDTDNIYGNSVLQQEMAQMLERFRRADCIIQAVDISGLRGGTAAEQRVRSVGRDALFYIANDTGGGFYGDANDFGRQLSDVLSRTSVTYLLTFRAVDVVPDGSYRPIKVKVKADRKTQMSYRQGYFAPRPYSELHPLEKTLLASDAIASVGDEDGLAVNVLAAPFRASEASAYVPIIIEVDGKELVSDHEGQELPIELYAYVTNEHGEMKDFFTQIVTLNLAHNRSDFMAGGLKYYGHLDLQPGEYLVRVLVRNARTGRSGVKHVALDIPVFKEEEPFLLPPFFVAADGQWVLVREQTGDGYQSSVIYPFTVNGNPYIPAALPTLKGDQEAQLCLVAYNLEQGSLEVNGRVLSEDGSPVKGGELSLVERTVTGIEGLDKLLATFRPQGLGAGNYTLEVDVRHPSSGLMESNSIAFTVLN